MDLVLLWQWSAAVQVTSLLLIAVFLAALARSVGGPELRLWVGAWLCNFLALAITLFYWYSQPGLEWLPHIRWSYMTSKLAFVLLLLQGSWTLKDPASRFLAPRTIVAALSVYAVSSFWLVGGVDHIGIVQHVALTLLLTIGAVFVLRGSATAGLRWLGAGFVTRAALSAVETAAYAAQIVEAPALRENAAWFLSAHSSFDSGAEWLIALGSVLAISERTQQSLRRTNAELLAAQEGLRSLADRDPLTELANRRSLPTIFRVAKRTGAAMLFFDIDDFKAVNDSYGHTVGDRTLERFGLALKASFRPDDFIVRYAGDEFLVVARGLSREAVDERIGWVREQLGVRSAAGVPLTFSVGVAELAPGGDPDEALEAADAAMYKAKARRTEASAPVVAGS